MVTAQQLHSTDKTVFTHWVHGFYRNLAGVQDLGVYSVSSSWKILLIQSLPYMEYQNIPCTCQLEVLLPWESNKVSHGLLTVALWLSSMHVKVINLSGGLGTRLDY